jgi:hypothetical protein
MKAPAFMNVIRSRRKPFQKCLATCLLYIKEGRKREKTNCSSFAELDHLVRINIQSEIKVVKMSQCAGASRILQVFEVFAL